MAAAKRGPYCLVCMRNGDPVLLEFIPAHTEMREYGSWGGPIHKPFPVAPRVRYECNACGREDVVQVEPDWTPAEWTGESRI